MNGPHLLHFSHAELPDADDFRVRATVHAQDEPGAFRSALELVEHLIGIDEADKVAHEVDGAIQEDLGERLPVTHDDDLVFVYAKTPREASGAARLLVSVGEDKGMNVDIEIDRWHHDSEEWRPADQPLPRTSAEHEAERVSLMARESEESEELGDQWEVRVDAPHRRDAVELQRRLASEGIPSRRWYRHLFLHCATEFDAEELAERVAKETPDDFSVRPMGAPEAGPYQAAFPFAYLGGLSGT